MMLRRSEEEPRALFAAMSDHILIHDRQGRLLRIAPTTPRVTLDTADMIGKALSDVFPAEQAAAMLSYIHLALDSKQAVNVEYQAGSGNSRSWLSAVVSPMGED